MNEEREKLIEEISQIRIPCSSPDGMTYICPGSVMAPYFADYILADRKRICEPLVKWRTNKYDSSMHIYDVLNETLNRAGETK